MAISKGSLLGREDCCFMLAVEQYDLQDIDCILYAGSREQGVRCHSFTDLAQQMEHGFELMNYPTPSVRKRRFSAGRGAVEAKGEACVIGDRKEGRLATFRIRVKQCLNATWQGQVSRNEAEEQAEPFESYLELIEILDRMLAGDRKTSENETTEQETLVAGLCDALLLGGRYSGIQITQKDSPEILGCARNLQNGGRETFTVRPLFQENHTFQGVLCWTEGRQQRNFRSFLELLMLLLSVAETPARQGNDR